MSKIIVLVTSGKLDSVDSVSVSLFDSRREAKDFIETSDNVKTKYWKSAVIIDEDESIELSPPEFN